MTPFSIRGRASKAQGNAAFILRTLAQTVLFWTFFLLAMPWLIHRLERFLNWDQWRFQSTTLQWIAFGLFTVGGSLGITSGLVMAVAGRGTPLPFDCPNRLVIVGPYRFMRNPMVVAGLTQGVAVGLWMGSLPVIVYALCGAPVWNWLVRPWEERDLTERFGDAYSQYKRAVPCWRFRLTPFSPPDS